MTLLLFVAPCLVSVIGSATTDKKAAKSLQRANSREKKFSRKKSSTDVKLEAMDQKWTKHFSRLKVFLLLHYNSLPCGIECCSWMAAGIRPTSKKK